MDYKEYKQIYDQLQSEQGRLEIEKDAQARAEMMSKLNEFLEKYPSVVPLDKRPDTPFHLLSLKEVFHRMMLTTVDIVNEVGEIASAYNVEGATATRRKIFQAFTREDRRLYIGIWLIFFAFVFFFIDGSS